MPKVYFLFSLMLIEKWNEELKQFVEVEATEEDIESMTFQIDYDAALRKIERQRMGAMVNFDTGEIVEIKESKEKD